MSSSDFSWPFLSSPFPSPTSVPGYQTAAASLAAPAHMVVEPMDWQPEGRSVAVEAWKYQAITLPALVVAGGPFELPPSYSYFPKPINWEARGEYQRLCENGGTQEQFLQWQLGLDSWYRQHLAAAVEEDKLFLESRYWAAARDLAEKQESLRSVVEIVRQQEAVQKEFEFRPRELKEYVEREQGRAGLLLRVRSRTGGLRQRQFDQLVATSASSSSSSPSSVGNSSSFGSSSSSSTSSSSSSSLASSTTTVSSDSTPPPPPPPTPSPPQVEVTIKPGVADQGSAFRGLSAPSVLTSSPPSSSGSVLDLFAPAKFRGKTAGVMNEF